MNPPIWACGGIFLSRPTLKSSPSLRSGSVCVCVCVSLPEVPSARVSLRLGVTGVRESRPKDVTSRPVRAGPMSNP